MDFCSKSVRDASYSPFDCLLFDLDDTLYPLETGIAAACKRNIDEFLVEKFGFSKDKASSVRVELFKGYGSTLAGLRALGYDIDADDYHGFVHGRLPYDAIKPDPQLRHLLRSIKQRKLIFTNSDKNHAFKVLERLGLLDCFEKIICFETINPNLPKSTKPDEFPIVLKPSTEALKVALSVAEVDPRRTLFLDDNHRNIAAGKGIGLSTVLVGKPDKTEEADYAVENVVNLKEVIPEIWNDKADGGDQRIARSRSRSEIDAALTATPVGA